MRLAGATLFFPSILELNLNLSPSGMVAGIRTNIASLKSTVIRYTGMSTIMVVGQFETPVNQILI